jgi:hypothetical protein
MHVPLHSTTFRALIVCACLAAAPSEAQQRGGLRAGVQSQVVATERMGMELVLERLSIQPGGELWVALRMRTNPGWYTC